MKPQFSDMIEDILPVKLLQIINNASKIITSASLNYILSEDMYYKWHFVRDYMPNLYRKHISELYLNCVFCSHLVQHACSGYSHKCSIGTYIHSGPLLPGILYKNGQNLYNADIPIVPWYYREPCSNFKRLPSKHYFKNFNILSSIGIYNLEALEGLEKGLSMGEKPCHICASLDYELYSKCTEQEHFNRFTPCYKIKSQLLTFYQAQSKH